MAIVAYTFSSSFGSYGSGKGLFIYPHGIACDATGNVSDCGNNCIQVFTAEGRFLKVLNSFGFGRGGLEYPYGVVSCMSVSVIIIVSQCSHLRVTL